MKILLLFAITILIANLVKADDLNDDHPVVGENTQTTGALVGKRLFFTAHERDASNEKPNTVPSGESADTILEVDGGQFSESAIIEKVQTPESIVVRYDARVESKGTVRFVINETPCELVGDAANHAKIVSRKLNCPSLLGSDVHLVLLADDRSIQVVRGSVIAGIVKPGQQL